MPDHSGAAAETPTVRPPSRRRRRLILLGVAFALLAPPLAWIGHRVRSGNFGVVQPGRVYRSGQLGPEAFMSVIGTYRIKTVLNLRGPNPKQAWYRDERDAVLAGGATHIDVPLSSCEWMSRAQAAALLDVLETAERPLLVHCQWGSERTGMVSAFLELLRPGATLAEARAQFSAKYLYLPVGNGVVTQRHLKQYETWLADRALDHSSERFRRWIAGGFRPGKPSREDWPYDPYPLVVIDRPRKPK